MEIDFNSPTEKQITCFWEYLPNYFSVIPNYFSGNPINFQIKGNKKHNN